MLEHPTGTERELHTSKDISSWRFGGTKSHTAAMTNHTGVGNGEHHMPLRAGSTSPPPAGMRSTVPLSLVRQVSAEQMALPKAPASGSTHLQLPSASAGGIHAGAVQERYQCSGPRWNRSFSPLTSCSQLDLQVVTERSKSCSAARWTQDTSKTSSDTLQNGLHSPPSGKLRPTSPLPSTHLGNISATSTNTSTCLSYVLEAGSATSSPSRFASAPTSYLFGQRHGSPSASNSCLVQVMESDENLPRKPADAESYCSPVVADTTMDASRGRLTAPAVFQPSSEQVQSASIVNGSRIRTDRGTAKELRASAIPSICESQDLLASAVSDGIEGNPTADPDWLCYRASDAPPQWPGPALPPRSDTTASTLQSESDASHAVGAKTADERAGWWWVASSEVSRQLTADTG